MTEAEKKQQDISAGEGLKKLVTFIGIIIFLIWFVPYECRTGELWATITFVPFGLGCLMGWWHGLHEGVEEGRIQAIREYMARHETSQTRE